MEPLTFDAIEKAIKAITDSYAPRKEKVLIHPFLENSRVAIKSGDAYYVCKDFVPEQCEKIIDIGEIKLEIPKLDFSINPRARWESFFGKFSTDIKKGGSL